MVRQLRAAGGDAREGEMTESKAQVKVGGNATPPNNALLDQYKQYAGDLGSIGTRYTAAQSFYFTLVAALIGVLALKDSGNVAGYVNTKFVAVMLFIAAICYIWRETLLHYQRLFRAKFDILRQLENIGLYTVYQAESERLKELIQTDSSTPGKIPSLIDSEARIPLFLMFVAILIALASIGYLVLNPK
jgi:hypothetical protein